MEPPARTACGLYTSPQTTALATKNSGAEMLLFFAVVGRLVFSRIRNYDVSGVSTFWGAPCQRQRKFAIILIHTKFQGSTMPPWPSSSFCHLWRPSRPFPPPRPDPNLQYLSPPQRIIRMRPTSGGGEDVYVARYPVSFPLFKGPCAIHPAPLFLKDYTWNLTRCWMIGGNTLAWGNQPIRLSSAAPSFSPISRAVSLPPPRTACEDLCYLITLVWPDGTLIEFHAL